MDTSRQIVTWTAFAILAMFSCVNPFQNTYKLLLNLVHNKVGLERDYSSLNSRILLTAFQ